MELRLKVEGATPDELQRGIDAAWAVFKKHGMDPVTAAGGMLALEDWDDAGFPDDSDDAMTEEEGRAADVWMEANEAAVKACSETWAEPAMVYTYSLELLTPQEKAARQA